LHERKLRGTGKESSRPTPMYVSLPVTGVHDDGTFRAFVCENGANLILLVIRQIQSPPDKVEHGTLMGRSPGITMSTTVPVERES
jgi:hypothetical protein